MPFNVSGIFQRLYDWTTDRDNSIKINADRMDAEFENYAAGMNEIVDGTQAFIGPIRVPYGTVSLPGVQFSGDADSGVYREAADTVAITAGGTKRVSFSSAGVNVAGVLNLPAGTAAAPSAAATGDADTGVYFPAADSVAVTAGGTQRALVDATGLSVTGSIAATVDLDVTGDASIGDALDVVGAATLGGTLALTGAATLSSTLAVAGASTLTGAVAAGATLAVTGNSTLSGAVSAGSTLNVTGATTLAGALAVTGAATLANDIEVGGGQVVLKSDGDKGLEFRNAAGTLQGSLIYNNGGDNMILRAYKSGVAQVQVNMDTTLGLFDLFTGTFGGDGAGLTNLSTSEVLEAIAGAAVGAVGTYAFLLKDPAVNYAPGDTVSGSLLSYSNANSTGAAISPSGTWRCMGDTTAASLSDATTLWLRVA